MPVVVRKYARFGKLLVVLGFYDVFSTYKSTAVWEPGEKHDARRREYYRAAGAWRGLTSRSVLHAVLVLALMRAFKY